MTIDDLHIIGITVRKPKNQTPWAIDLDGPEVLPATLLLMQADALEIIKTASDVACASVANR